MATNKFLDMDGVKILWDKAKRTFLEQENAATDYLAKTENAVSATTAAECTGNAATASKLQNAKAITISDGENNGTPTNFDGSENISLNLPKKIKADIEGNATTATTLDTARSIQTNLENNSAANFDGSTDIKIGVTGILPTSNGGTGSNNLDNVIVGKSKKTAVLETARQIKTDLSSNNAANFNGSANINPGVTGILEVANGGTGNSAGNAATATKLLNQRAISIQDYLAVNTGRSTNFDGAADISLKLPETIQANLTGNATSATKAQQDFDGNVITSTYAPLESPALTGTPQAPTAEPNNDSRQLATTAFVAEAIRRLVGAAPETLDTLVELSVAINKDANFATTIANELAQKQNKSDALTSISNLLTSADKMIYTKSSNVYAATPLTSFARSLLDDANAVTARNTLDALGKTENAVSATTAAECTGNSATASKLQNARKISVQDFYSENSGADIDFDGSENISVKLPATIKAELDGNAKTSSKLQNAKTITISDGENNGVSTNFDGSENISLQLPQKIKATLDGNAKTSTRADSAAVADKLLTPRTLQTNLENNSAANFDGTENISLGVTGILPVANGGTGSNNLDEVKVGTALKAFLDSDGNAIVEKYQPKLLKIPLTIPTSDWQITDRENYNFCHLIEIENISPNDIININLLPQSHGAAITCGLCATVEISDGVISLFAKSAPTAEIFAEYYILKGAETLREIGYGAINTSTSQREIIYNTPTQDGKLIYTGGELRPIWKNYDPTKLLISGEISGVNAKTYAVYFTPIGNCTWSDDSRTPRRVIWKIEKAVIQMPIQSGKLIYSGESQTPNLLNYDSAKMILSGDFENKIDAGIYTAYAAPNDNFIFEDNSTAAKSFTWQIEKAELEFSLDKNSLYLENAKISDSIAVTRAGDGVISATSADSSVATVAVDGENILVTALATGNTEIIIQIAEGTNYFASGAVVDVETFVIKPLSQCTPEEILDAVKSEKAVDAWQTGDKTSPITLSGQIGAALTLNNFEICARILGFNHNSQLESGGKSSVHFALDVTVDGVDVAFCDSNFDSASASGTEYFQHNTKFGSNAGGWTESNIRTKILADIFNALPQDWQDIISPCTKYTGNAEFTQDNLFLLSEFEIFGRQDYANDAEQNFNLQYDYFKNGNDTIHFKHAEISTPCYWWLRTPQESNTTSFCRVDVDGAETTFNALYSLGIVPCFVVS